LVGGLLYGFSIAGEQGWGSLQVYGTILLGVICLVLFILRQFKLEIPMLEFRIFKYPLFTLSAVISIALNIALFSGMILMPIYVQTIRGFSPLDSGILLLPGAIIMAIMSPVTGRLFDKYGARSLGIIGFALTAFTTYLFSNLTMDTSYTELLIIYAIRSLGISMVMMPIMTNGLNQLPAKYNPHGTALNNTLSQVSGAIGSALLITVMSTRTATYAKEMAATEMGKLTEQPSTALLTELQNKAMIEGINDAFLVSVGIICIALILTFFAKRATPQRILTNLKQKHLKITIILSG
jgi:EmrB/QacA subfamily drug resistance transporter